MKTQLDSGPAGRWPMSALRCDLMAWPICVQRRLAVTTLLVALAICGCATDPRSVSQSATLTRDEFPRDTLTITRPTTLNLPSGLRAPPLASGSTWDQVGTIQQGNVYRLRNGVFVIDARHRHEAFLTANDGRIVGLYLPFKHLMVPVSPPVFIHPSSETIP
ncbi:MAG: hypothetical protein GMKNLPBB_01419 [Myxococcota bacterium]|nr:hypothetical protein [Myxococcota bacterium]